MGIFLCLGVIGFIYELDSIANQTVLTKERRASFIISAVTTAGGGGGFPNKDCLRMAENLDQFILKMFVVMK